MSEAENADALPLAPDSEMPQNPDGERLWLWVQGELFARYGEGEDTDWPWFNDLVEVVVELVERWAE